MSRSGRLFSPSVSFQCFPNPFLLIDDFYIRCQTLYPGRPLYTSYVQLRETKVEVSLGKMDSFK